MNTRIVRAGAMIAGVVLSSVATAQWSNDASVNLTVAGGAGSQSVPIIRPAADGGVWIYFYDTQGGSGLKPTIQRLTAAGEKVFPGNGIVLANRRNTASFTTDMRVAADGTAFASFDDDSSGTNQTTVQKILPDGTLAWGATGIQMPSSNSFSTRVAICPDNTIVCTYVVSNVITLQRINQDGTLVPGENWTVSETSRAVSPSDLIPGTTGGDVILMWVRAEGTNMVTSRKGLKIQKWNATHQPLWNAGTPLNIYTSSATPSKGIQVSYFPILVPDTQGGAVVAWYDSAGTRNAWLQHVLPDGTFRFTAEGMGMTDVPIGTQYRLSAAVAYDAVNDSYVVAYETSNPLQSLFGMGAQRVDSDGVREWGTTGIELMPVATNHKSFINTRVGPGGSTVVSWLDYQGANFPMLVRARRLDTTGADVWAPGTLDVCSAATTKGRLMLSNTIGSDMLVAAWQDDGSGTTDIKAQNINMDGTLGPAFRCPADFNQDGGVDGADVEAFYTVWEAGDSAADVNQDGGIDGADVETFFAAWEAGGCN